MRLVLCAIENGSVYRNEMQKSTGLTKGQVDSAVKNLAYTGAIVRKTDASGRSIYDVPGKQGPVSPIWKCVRSVFDVATSVENQLKSTPDKD